jgi:hypothetical protein
MPPSRQDNTTPPGRTRSACGILQSCIGGITEEIELS